MLHTYGPAQTRASTGGLSNLRFAPSRELGRYPPAVPSDYTNTDVEKIHVPMPKEKRDRKFLSPKSVSSNQFKAQAHGRYQGMQRGPTGSDFLQLPEAWNPVETASYQPDIAGRAFETGNGQVSDMNNMTDKKLPVMDAQFHKKGSFLTPDAPNPFPVELSGKFKIR